MAGGRLDAKREELNGQIEELWQDSSIEKAEALLPGELASAAAEIAGLGEAIEAENAKVSLRCELAKEIPEKEMALKQAVEENSKIEKELESKKSAMQQKKKQHGGEKEKLRFANRNEAEKAAGLAETKIKELKKAYDEAQRNLQESSKKIAGEESLDQAMRALSGLAAGNRLVGIISHVSELKNRIDKQIVVTKQKNGGSRADIIA